MSSNPAIEVKTKPLEPKKEENLKQRAYLNTVTSVLDYGATLITAFFVTPFIVNTLGAALYGVWQVLGQFTGYTNIADARVAEVLKWAIARDRKENNADQLREYFTATFFLIMLILPILLVLGAVISWYAPIVTKVDPEYADMVRITCGVLVLSLATQKVFNIFESILRGMNLGFKRMGFRVFIVVVGGGLKVLVLFLGYGLIGLATVQLIVSLITGITIYVIVKHNVSWFGFGKLSIARSKIFLKVSGWFMGWTVTKILLLSSDKLLLGFLLGPTAVAKYTLTKFLAETIRSLVVTIVNGVIPGLGKLYGSDQMKKFMKAREMVMNLTWLFAVSFGAVILSLNSSFVALWVGYENYAGHIVSLLVVIMTIQYIFIQNDSDIINVTLDIRKKTLLGLFSAIVSIVLSILLIKSQGIIGLCMSLIVGRSILSISYPLLIKSKTKVEYNIIPLTIRQILITFIIYTTIFVFCQEAFINSWFELFISAPFILVFSLLMLFILGLEKVQREELFTLFKQLKLFRMDK